MATIVTLNPSGQKFHIIRFRDGDTVEGFMQCKTCNCARELVIRLRNIDSYELHKHGEREKAQLIALKATELYRGKEGIFVGNPLRRDKYGRTVGDVWLGGELLSNLMVFGTFAWYIPNAHES